VQTFKFVADVLQLLFKNLVILHIKSLKICKFLSNTLYEVRLNQNLKFVVNYPTECTVSTNEILEEVI
jgi:hypothetical protein